MTARIRARHPRAPLLATHPGRPRRRRRSRARLGREVELVEVTTEGDRSSRARSRQIGGTGVFVSALRDALLARRRRRRRALAQGPAHRARRRASRWPPYRRARTRATCSSPATGSPSASCRPAPGRHRLAAPGRPAARARPRPRGRRASAATSTPGSRKVAAGESTPSSSPAPGWPGSAGSTRSPRCSTRCRCCPPPGRVRWRSSAAPTTTSLAAELGRARRPAHPRRASTAERAVLADPRGRLLRPGRGPGRGGRGRRRRRAVGARRRARRPTARSSVRMSATGAPSDAAGVGPRLASEMLAEGAARPDDNRTSTGRHSEKAVTHDARQDQHRTTAPRRRTAEPRLGVLRRQRPG